MLISDTQAGNDMIRVVVKLEDDAYVGWSSIVDAPSTDVVTRAELVEAGISEDRINRADQNGFSYLDRSASSWQQGRDEIISCNRAGPREACLTLEALLVRYARGGAGRNMPLTVDEISPYTTSYVGETQMYWVPWAPGEGPEAIDGTTDLHAMVAMSEAQAQAYLATTQK